VLAGVHQMERRVIERLDALDRKIEELAQRIGRAEKGVNTGAEKRGAGNAPRRGK